MEKQKEKKKTQNNQPHNENETEENKGEFLKHMNCIKELDMHLF